MASDSPGFLTAMREEVLPVPTM